MKLINYEEHPADNRYYVFRFFDEDIANEFAELLASRNVTFERDSEGVEQDITVYFGIHKDHFKDALWCNNMIHAKYRKPFIPSAVGRWALLLFVALMITLAFIGFFKAQG